VSQNTPSDLDSRTSRKRHNYGWFRKSARVPENICYPRQESGAKVMAFLVGEVERCRIAAVSENASHILGPEAE